MVLAAVDLIKANGRRYWGDTSATPDRPGANIRGARAASPRRRCSTARERSPYDVALRTLLGLIAGVGVAFALHYLDDRRPTTDDRRLTIDDSAALCIIWSYSLFSVLEGRRICNSRTI